MQYEELKEKIIQWGKDRNIFEYSTAIKRRCGRTDTSATDARIHNRLRRWYPLRLTPCSLNQPESPMNSEP